MDTEGKPTMETLSLKPKTLLVSRGEFSTGRFVFFSFFLPASPFPPHFYFQPAPPDIPAGGWVGGWVGGQNERDVLSGNCRLGYEAYVFCPSCFTPSFHNVTWQVLHGQGLMIYFLSWNVGTVRRTQ